MYRPIFYQMAENRLISGSINGITINLVQDCRNIFEKRLRNQKINRKSKKDPGMDYFRLQDRILEAKPRKIFIAKDFECPSNYEQELEFLKISILQGKDLNKFMTRNVKKLKAEDLMLYDWGIYHFHLSKKLDEKKKDGFMERSKYLLMARVEDNAVYMIKIVPHQQKNIWTQREYIEILEDNWPYLIRRNKIENVKMEYEVSEEEHYKFRKAGITTFTKGKQNCLYAMLGGGYSSDGSSTRAVQKSGKFMYLIYDIEEMIVKDFWKWVNRHSELLNLFEGKKAKIKLVEIWNDNFLLKEESTDLYIRLTLERNVWNIILASKERVFEKEWKNL